MSAKQNVQQARSKWRCTFCDAKASRKGEHFWPDWAKDLLPTSEKTVLSFERNGKMEDFEERNGAPKAIKIRRVCEKCNNVWMSQLEAKMKPIILSLTSVTVPFSLSEAEMLTIASWVTLKILVSDARRGKDAIFTKQDYERFSQDQMPLPRVSISLYNYPGPDSAIEQYCKNSGKVAGADGKIAGQIGNFTFFWRPVLFQAWVFRVNGMSSGPLNQQNHDVRAVPIWPLSGRSAAWPGVPINPKVAHTIQHALDYIPSGLARTKKAGQA